MSDYPIAMSRDSNLRNPNKMWKDYWGWIIYLALPGLWLRFNSNAKKEVAAGFGQHLQVNLLIKFYSN